MSKVLTLRDALNEAMSEEMRRDENVFLLIVERSEEVTLFLPKCCFQG